MLILGDTSDDEGSISTSLRFATPTIQRVSPASSATRQRRQVPPDSAQKYVNLIFSTSYYLFLVYTNKWYSF